MGIINMKEKVFSFLWMKICSKHMEELQAHRTSASLPTSSFSPWASYLAAGRWVGLGSFPFLSIFHISPTECGSDRKNATEVLHKYPY